MSDGMENTTAVDGDNGPSRLGKLRFLLSLALRNPSEFRDRVSAVVQVQHDSLRRSGHYSMASIEFDDAVATIGDNLQRDLLQFAGDDALARIETEVQSGLRRLRGRSAFRLSHNADLSLARLVYSICRATLPEVVVETGVAHGVTSAFLLQALAVNGKGRLVSVDLPPLGPNADRCVGCLVPTALRDRWMLHRGASHRVFRRLLPELGTIDLFVHDSLHTQKNMLREFASIWPSLRTGGVLIADDIESNAAFEIFAGTVKSRFHATVREQEKQAAFGVLIKAS